MLLQYSLLSLKARNKKSPFLYHQSLDRATSEDIENMLESVAQNLRMGETGNSSSDTAKRQYLQGGPSFPISGYDKCERLEINL